MSRQITQLAHRIFKKRKKKKNPQEIKEFMNDCKLQAQSDQIDKDELQISIASFAG